LLMVWRSTVGRRGNQYMFGALDGGRSQQVWMDA
jgi:hypothetical protein